MRASTLFNYDFCMLFLILRNTIKNMEVFAKIKCNCCQKPPFKVDFGQTELRISFPFRLCIGKLFRPHIITSKAVPVSHEACAIEVPFVLSPIHIARKDKIHFQSLSIENQRIFLRTRNSTVKPTVVRLLYRVYEAL